MRSLRESESRCDGNSGARNGPPELRGAANRGEAAGRHGMAQALAWNRRRRPRPAPAVRSRAIVVGSGTLPGFDGTGPAAREMVPSTVDWPRKVVDGTSVRWFDGRSSEAM